VSRRIAGSLEAPGTGRRGSIEDVGGYGYGGGGGYGVGAGGMVPKTAPSEVGFGRAGSGGARGEVLSAKGGRGGRRIGWEESTYAGGGDAGEVYDSPGVGGWEGGWDAGWGETTGGGGRGHSRSAKKTRGEVNRPLSRMHTHPVGADDVKSTDQVKTAINRT
jgi:hypothetical protein